MKLRVAGLDPALKNFGLAKGLYDVETGELKITEVELVETERDNSKQIRRNSDDLARSSSIISAMHPFIADCAVVFGEVPSGGQSASAAKAFGIAIGIMAAIGIVGPFKGRLIQVTPAEVKKAATGSKVASKDEMIEWAMKRWPFAGWLTRKLKGEIVPVEKNEHMADACGAIFAGIQTAEFKNLVLMLQIAQAQTQAYESQVS